MGTPVRNGQPECGNGVIEIDEECDDGNRMLEPCETPELNFGFRSQCREERVLNPSCGNGPRATRTLRPTGEQCTLNFVAAVVISIFRERVGTMSPPNVARTGDFRSSISA